VCCSSSEELEDRQNEEGGDVRGDAGMRDDVGMCRCLTCVVGASPSKMGSCCVEAVVRVKRGGSSFAVNGETVTI
jgi:hypothetical protein